MPAAFFFNKLANTMKLQDPCPRRQKRPGLDRVKDYKNLKLSARVVT